MAGGPSFHSWQSAGDAIGLFPQPLLPPFQYFDIGNNLWRGLRETLDREGVDFARFRENIRKEIIINQLQQRQVFNRITITKQEIDNFLTNQSLQGAVKGEYNIAHIHFALPD